MYRGEEDSLRPLAVYIESKLAVGGIESRVEVVSLVGFIAHDVAIAGSVLHSDESVVGEFDAGASCSLLVLKLNLQQSVPVLCRVDIELHVQQGLSARQRHSRRDPHRRVSAICLRGKRVPS